MQQQENEQEQQQQKQKQQQHNGAKPVNKDQSGFWPGLGHMSRDPAHSETRKNHKARQENSCVDHLAMTRRKHSHMADEQKRKQDSLKQSVLSWQGRTFSTFKGIAQNTSMENQQPTSQNDAKEKKGVTGLANMRNTCYMNAALQALRHNTEVTAFFLEGRFEKFLEHKPNSAKVNLVRGYADLLKSLWSGSYPAYVRPGGFLQSMLPAAKESGFDQFLIPMQHDSHEFITFLLDQLHEGMAEEVNIEIVRPPPITQKDKAIQAALEAWKRHFGKQYSPLTEMIYGLFRVTLTCKGCGHHSDSWETFNCLKMPIPQNLAEDGEIPTIQSMLKEEFKDEEIEGYACDHCAPRRTTAIRSTRIWRMPRMITMSVKRFTMDGRKIHTTMKMEQTDGICFKEFFSPDSGEPSQFQKYECFAIVDHHGSAGGGHYTAQAKSPLTEKWHIFDDETTMKIDSPTLGSNTYVLVLKPSC